MPYDEAVLDELAREILSVDADGNSLLPLYQSILESGLPTKLAPDAERRDVIVIGAGIAGLVTGKLLKDAGYDVTILEANDSRVGGRVKTFHTTAEDGPAFNDPLQYAEAGAMRIPTTHVLVNTLIRVMGLADRLQPFYNVDIEKDSPPGKPTIAQRTWTCSNGVRLRRGDYQSGNVPAEERTVGFPVGKAYNQPADRLLSQALAPVNELIDPTLPIDEQIAGWKEVLEKYDSFSMYRYLTEVGGFPETVVEYVGTLQNLTSRLFLSFLHSFIDTFYLKAGASYVELAGGNWQLPYAFLPFLEEELVMDSRVVEVQWSDGEAALAPKAVHRGRPGVYVRAVNEPTTKRGRVRPGRVRFEREFTADYLVVTIPFSALRFVSVSPPFHYEKSRAITELHYDSATKVLLEFNERFWEWDEETWGRRIGGEYRGHDSYGGGSLTDRPIRFAYFPSHRVPGSKGGVVLASYTWADDASRWDSIPAEDRYNYALDGLVEIYGVGIKKFFTGCGRTESWMENYYAYGEAAVFTPGQLVHLHPHVRSPEGPLVHFAGEHTSLKHAWIEGAIESGIRAALEIHGQGGA